MRMRLAICAAALAGAMSVVSGAAAAKQLIFGSYLPPKHNANTYGLEPLFEALKPKLDWKLVSGGQLFSGAATLKSVGNRVADAGVVIPSYVQSALKYGFLSMDLMYVANDAMAFNAAIMDTFFNDCPQCLAEYHKAKTVLLATYGVDGWSALCRDDVKTVADLQGKRIRTSGALGRFAQALGATPVAMTSGDMVEAISRGQIDCISGAIAWLKSYPIQDSVKSILALRKGATVVDLFVMNRASWKALTKDEKMAMLRAMPGASARTTVAGYMGDDVRAQKMAKDLNIPIYDPPPSFEQKFADFRKKERDLVIERAKKRGAKDAEKIVDAIFRNYDKWVKILGPSDRSDLKALTAKYEKALWDHLYSKLDPNKL